MLYLSLSDRSVIVCAIKKYWLHWFFVAVLGKSLRSLLLQLSEDQTINRESIQPCLSISTVYDLAFLGVFREEGTLLFDELCVLLFALESSTL